MNVQNCHKDKGKGTKEKIGDKIAAAHGMNSLATSQHALGEWDNAIESSKNALDIFQKNREHFAVARTYNNLGLIYSDKGEWDRAIEYYEKSLEIKKNPVKSKIALKGWPFESFIYCRIK